MVEPKGSGGIVWHYSLGRYLKEVGELSKGIKLIPGDVSTISILHDV